MRGVTTARRALVLAALLCATWPAARAAAQARPQDVPHVLLVGVEPTSRDVPPLVARRAAEQIARDLAAQPEIDLMAIVDDQVDLATTPPPPPIADRLDEGNAALVASRSALDLKDWTRAEEQARRALEAIAFSAAVLADEELLVEGDVTLGVALALGGRDADARAAFRQAAASGPTAAAARTGRS